MSEASVDDSSTIMIPKNASESDVTTSLKKSSSSDGSVIGLMEFKYGNKKVGTCQLKANTSEESSYPFHNLSANLDDKNDSSSFIQVNIFLIVIAAALALTAAIGIFFLLRHIYWSVSKHQRDVHSAKKGRIKYKKIRNNDKH